MQGGRDYRKCKDQTKEKTKYKIHEYFHFFKQNPIFVLWTNSANVLSVLLLLFLFFMKWGYSAYKVMLGYYVVKILKEKKKTATTLDSWPILWCLSMRLLTCGWFSWSPRLIECLWTMCQLHTNCFKCCFTLFLIYTRRNFDIKS